MLWDIIFNISYKQTVDVKIMTIQFRKKALLAVAAIGAFSANSYSVQAEEGLLYWPVTPCRIVDTRRADIPGRILAGESKQYHVYGSGNNADRIAAQGGNLEGCRSPGGNPLAVHINLISANQTGNGNVVVYPAGETTPNATLINYRQGVNISNAAIVKTCQQCSPKSNISVVSGRSDTHVIMDVMGYYFSESGGAGDSSPIILEDIGNNSFHFNAQAGKSYVIELFNVARNFENIFGNNCHPNRNNNGIGLVIFDPSSTETAKQCSPQGFGNVHNSIQIKSGIGGEFQIDVVPNLKNADISGSFSLRVQPKYDNSNVIWDTNFEPNNRAVIASPIGIGAQNALTSNIEERNSSFATSQADFDWYHFDTIANQEYIIEIFNVIKLLETESGTNCNPTRSENGVGLKILDSLFTEIKSECFPNGTGNVHNRIRFKSGLGGVFHIGIIPNSKAVFGTYSLRVLPFHDDPSSSWDINTYEPNNNPVNAFIIEPLDVLTSQIEERNTSFATNSVDLDYYRFEAEASQIYRIELLDVASNLKVGIGTNCNPTRNESGIGLKVFDSMFVVLGSQCDPTDEQGIHNTIEFKTGLSGTYYIGVIPNSKDSYGAYSLRLSKI